MTTDEGRAEEARRVLQNPLYLEAYTQIEFNIVNRLAQQGTKADEAEDLRRLLIAMRKVKTYMDQVVTTGKMAALAEEKNPTLLDRIIYGSRG